MPLFDDSARRKLEQLTLIASQVRAGAIKGDRRSTRRGTSTEFADTRDYVAGDDLRRFDWNAYARLDRPLIRLYEDEEDLAIHLLIDASASMDTPPDDSATAEAAAAPSAALSKFDMARRLIAGLGIIGLTTNDRVTVTAFGGSSAQGGALPDGSIVFPPARGRAAIPRLLAFVEGLAAGGTVDLNAALRRYVTRAGRPGLCVLVSDLMTPEGVRDGLNALVGRGYQVGVVHVLSPDELDPPLAGDLRLVDSETRAGQDVTLDPDLRARYLKRLAAWREAVAAECRGRGAAFVGVVSNAAWERVILYDLRRAGLVR